MLGRKGTTTMTSNLKPTIKYYFVPTRASKLDFLNIPHNLRSMCFSPNSLIFTLCKFQIAVVFSTTHITHLSMIYLSQIAT